MFHILNQIDYMIKVQSLIPCTLDRYHITIIVLFSVMAACESTSSYDHFQVKDEQLEDICVAPYSMGSPSSIEEFIELTNALSKTTIDVKCIIESLDRPLKLVATQGVLSAQPAGGKRDPRIFIIQDEFIISVVPNGPGRSLIELGEYVIPTESLKGELHMPIERPITLDHVFGHLRYSESLTVCGFCHYNERPSTTINHPNAHISMAFKPLNKELILLEDLETEHELCTQKEQLTYRCEIYKALFDHGQVKQGAFPVELKTIHEAILD
jgi:hypothetical protein